MTKMKPKLKKRWVEALRSGRYAQTRNYLRKADGYCCLGVLADVKKDLDWKPDGPLWMLTQKGSDVEFELEDAGIKGLDTNTLDALIDMNDKQGANFDEIASWIEREL